MKSVKFNELIKDIDDFNISDVDKKKVDKLVLTFDNEEQIKKFDDIYSELLLRKIYPLTRGIPFCKARIEHCTELFCSDGTGKKKKECKSCKLLKYCNYDSNQSDPKNSNHRGFNVKPIMGVSDDLITFLEERNESLNDWI